MFILDIQLDFWAFSRITIIISGASALKNGCYYWEHPMQYPMCNFTWKVVFNILVTVDLMINFRYNTQTKTGIIMYNCIYYINSRFIFSNFLENLDLLVETVETVERSVWLGNCVLAILLERCGRNYIFIPGGPNLFIMEACIVYKPLNQV